MDSGITGAKPLVALTLGDPAGIGPEIALAALCDRTIAERMRLLVIGPAAARPARIPSLRVGTGGALSSPPGAGHAWLETDAPAAWRMGFPQESCGLAAVAALRAGHQLAISGAVDALVTGPVSKSALHMAGEKVEGQTELLGRWSGVERFEMMAIAGRLRVMLLTRHLPLRLALRESGIL